MENELARNVIGEIAGQNAFAAVCAWLMLVWRLRRERSLFATLRSRELLAFTLPVAACVLTLAAYNYVRFGDPLEFGLRYQIAGADYRGLLVFAYLLHPSVQLAADTPDLFAFRGKRYLFRAIDVSDYRDHMHLLSPSWQTVTLPREAFRALVRPMRDFLRPCTTDVPF